MALDKHGAGWRVRVTHRTISYSRIFETEGGAKECNAAIFQGKEHNQMDTVIWHYFSPAANVHHRLLKMAEELDGMITLMGHLLNDYDPAKQ